MATEQDAPRIGELYLQLYSHIHKTTGGTLEKKVQYAKRKMNEENYFIFVAVKEEIVGTVAVKIKSKKRAYIGDAYVEPDFRRQGVMRELEKAVTAFLKERGVSVVELDVIMSNTEGVKTWPALGYEPYKQFMKKRI